MAGSLAELRLAELKTSGAQASRHFQVWRRCSRRAAAVLCAFGGLGILIASAALWHHFHHGEHHGHAHKLVRQRHHLPTWMHFPSPVKIGKKRLRGRKLKLSLHLHLPHLPHMPHLPQGIKRMHKKEKVEHVHAELPCESEHHHPHHSQEQHSHHHHHEHSLVEELVAYPRVFVAEVVAVVFLSTLFETWEHWVRHRLAHQGRTSELRILDCLFKEVTCLGFIGLVLYLLHRFSLADLLASKIFLPEELVEENPLFETFELVHMMIFMLLIVLLFQAAALLPISHAIVENWREYERIRAWGQSASCMETQFVQAGYLRRVTCPDSPRGIELQYVRPFTYGDSWKERWTLRKDPVVKIIMWRALRHEFLCDNKEETPTHRSNHGHGHDHHGKHGKHHHQHKPHINPALFSYEGYLRGLLSNTVVALVEVDMTTWGVTLMALIPLMYSCICFSCSIEFLQCMIAWVLVAGAAVLAMCLEEDIHKLTPDVPEDARLILRLFSGTSIHDFQRSSGPDRADPGHDSYHGAPGLGGVSCTDEDFTKLMKAEKHTEDEVIMSCESYRRLFHVVAFWQAICVTSLVVSFLSHPFARTSSVVLHLLAWAEWPLMLFCVWPMLVQRLTIRYSVDETRDYGLIRSVAIHSKEALLRHHIRLAQVMGFYKRGLEANENWTQLPSAAASASVAKPQAKSGRRNSLTMGRQRSWKAAFTKVDADKNFRHGHHLFHGLSDDQQEEVLELFQIMDNDNDESVSMDEIAGKFRSMGFKDDADMAARSVFRLVQHNSSQFFATRFLNDQGSVPTLSCDKFCAMIALTTTNRLEAELEDDILSIFRLVDKASPEVVTVFELTEWMRGIKKSLTEGDVATVLHKHFGEAKPTLMRWEFLEWFEALAGGDDDEEPHH